MQAIKTRYKGILFRSKLEAEWAKFFDSLEIPWLYEPEGFQFSDGTMYLPDFWLPDSKQWFEVKGILNDKDQHKMEMLCLESNHDVVIGHPDGEFSMMDLWHNDEAPSLFDPYLRPDEPTQFKHVEVFGKDDTFLNCCEQCGKYSFMEGCGSYACQCCGAYDGDHYCNWVMDGVKNFHEYTWKFQINTYEWRKRSRIDVRNNN